MSAKYKVLEKRGMTLVVQVSLEDGRGFTLYIGEDRLKEIEKLIRDHARALFNVEVGKVDEAK